MPLDAWTTALPYAAIGDAVHVAFWAAAAVIAYIYLGYPLVLAVLGRLMTRPVAQAPIEPSVSLLIAAYNEADVIEAKIRNALELDYPPDRLEIVVASDGSTDGTAERAATLTDDPRVRVIAYPRNRGKLAVLNDTVPRLRGEIVVFSDASSMLARDALRHLVAAFADPQVGGVSGLYRVVRPGQSALGFQEDAYWRYETYLKRAEAALHSTLGAHGALYAIRRALYPFPNPRTINDDFVIPFRIVARGYRVVYEPAAVACEEASEMDGFTRRVRIMTGNIAQLAELGRLLRPLRPLPLFFFLSHKGGRLATPLAMVVLLAANVALAHEPFFRATLALQGMFYLLVALGAWIRIHPAVLRLPYYFCLINAAALVGCYHALRGGTRVAWKRS
ncbi:MAG TPA: glycosyltransferase family 2 protein [Vicinamibacterales bacterium]|nr:glycosyltransferase family 2 protein [Vicinamibacterales bacterium]